jgi:hypothetical protein
VGTIKNHNTSQGGHKHIAFSVLGHAAGLTLAAFSRQFEIGVKRTTNLGVGGRRKQRCECKASDSQQQFGGCHLVD